MFKRFSWRMLPPLFFLSLVCAYGGGWLYAAAEAKNSFAAWVERLRENGWRIECRWSGVRGSPLAFSWVLSEGTVETPSGLVWTFDRIVLGGSPWRRRSISVDFIQKHAVGLREEDVRLLLRAKRAHMTLVLTPQGDGWVGQADIKDLAASTVVGGDETPLASAAQLSATMEKPSQSEEAAPWAESGSILSASLRMESTRLASERAAEAGAIENITLDMRIVGMIGAGSLYQALAGWRDAGGVLDMDRLYVRWPPFEAAARGTLAFDGAMQPVGSLTMRLDGLFPMLDRLDAWGVLSKRNTTVARVVLGGIAARESGGDGGMTLPLSIQNGTMSLGPVPLMDVSAFPGDKKKPASSLSSPPSAGPHYEVGRFGRIVKKEKK